MKQKLTAEELSELEKQLNCPKGEKGVETGELMHNSNISMTIASINLLKLRDNNALLEIGHGNCTHLTEIIKQSKGISYSGLEISEVMQQEAIRINKKYLEENRISFELYDGENIPYKDDTFDKVFTVNTIYFWENPTDFFREVTGFLNLAGNLF